MKAEDYERSVKMLCPTCGGTQFEYEEADTQNDDCIFKCPRCGLELTKVELIERNSETIKANVKEIGQEVADDIKAELKKAFRSNKYIKIK